MVSGPWLCSYRNSPLGGTNYHYRVLRRVGSPELSGLHHFEVTVLFKTRGEFPLMACLVAVKLIVCHFAGGARGDRRKEEKEEEKGQTERRRLRRRASAGPGCFFRRVCVELYREQLLCRGRLASGHFRYFYDQIGGIIERKRALFRPPRLPSVGGLRGAQPSPPTRQRGCEGEIPELRGCRDTPAAASAIATYRENKSVIVMPNRALWGDFGSCAHQDQDQIIG